MMTQTETTQQHTAGPWGINARGICAPNGRQMFLFSSDHDTLGDLERLPYPKQLERLEADTRIVAAAPELLSQLETARDCIECLGGQLEQYHTAAWQFARTLDSIDTTIAKARHTA